MKKLLLVALAIATAGAGCASSYAPRPIPSTSTVPPPAQPVTSSTSSEMAPTSTAPVVLTGQDKILHELSVQWQKDGDIGASNGQTRDTADVMGSCRNLPVEPPSETAALVPPTYVKLRSIAEHGCGAILRVYLGCAQSIPETNSAPDQWVQVDGNWYACGDWEEKLILEDEATNATHVVADIAVQRGANSSALWVPIAFSKDEKNIILDAWMGSPGAGGGSVDYGYDWIPASTTNGTNKDLVYLAPRATFFYDAYGKMVYLMSSPDLPMYSQPGPSSNDGEIMSEDLATMQRRTALMEPDTTYKLISLDEPGHTATIEKTHHTFTASCPRQEDALYCTQKTTSVQKMLLP